MNEEKDSRNANSKYVRKDVYAAEKDGIIKICDEKHKVLDCRVEALEKAVKNTDRKITATLVFTIMTLVGLIVAIATHVLI